MKKAGIQVLMANSGEPPHWHPDAVSEMRHLTATGYFTSATQQSRWADHASATEMKYIVK